MGVLAQLVWGSGRICTPPAGPVGPFCDAHTRHGAGRSLLSAAIPPNRALGPSFTWVLQISLKPPGSRTRVWKTKNKSLRGILEGLLGRGWDRGPGSLMRPYLVSIKTFQIQDSLKKQKGFFKIPAVMSCSLFLPRLASKPAGGKQGLPAPAPL